MCSFTGKVLDEQRMHILLFVEQHPTHQHEHVSSTRCYGDEPDGDTQDGHVKQVGN